MGSHRTFGLKEAAQLVDTVKSKLFGRKKRKRQGPSLLAVKAKQRQQLPPVW